MPDVLTDAVKATIFGARRANKVTEEDYGSLPVATGQIKNAINSIMALDNKIGKGAQTAVDVFQKACKSEPILEYVGKGAKLAGDHVNSLICLSAGIKVFNADDKVAAGVQQGVALTSMFAVESLMKKHMDDITKIKGVDKIAQRVLEFSAKTPGFKPLPAIIKGVAFVIGSTTAFMVGEKVGKYATQDLNV